jgi:hypothetical protein
MCLSVHLPIDWHKLADTINPSDGLRGQNEKVFASFMCICIGLVVIWHSWTCNQQFKQNASNPI